MIHSCCVLCGLIEVAPHCCPLEQYQTIHALSWGKTNRRSPSRTSTRRWGALGCLSVHSWHMRRRGRLLWSFIPYARRRALPHIGWLRSFPDFVPTAHVFNIWRLIPPRGSRQSHALPPVELGLLSVPNLANQRSSSVPSREHHICWCLLLEFIFQLPSPFFPLPWHFQCPNNADLFRLAMKLLQSLILWYVLWCVIVAARDYFRNVLGV